MRRSWLVWSALLLTGCSKEMDMNHIAAQYVKLALRVGRVDPDFVDAYYGPDSLRPASTVTDTASELREMEREAGLLLDRLVSVPIDSSDRVLALRRSYLRAQLTAVRCRLQILQGKKMTFDEQAVELYQATPPVYGEDHFQKLLADLEKELPGPGTIQQRLEEFKNQYVIPADRIDTVFQTAIEECRRRTLQHVSLPEEESFVVEYVTGQPWSGYNWYKGNGFSLIQVNTDLPIFIDRALDLAAHEGYPGHHVYNALLEHHLTRKRGWVEFSVYPLFSPQSLIAEGSANYGKQLVFSPGERADFETRVLYPLAGLDPRTADRYRRVEDLTSRLAYAGNEAARNYLDGKWDQERCVEWLVRYGLYTRPAAQKRMRFIERYGAYVINYNYGQDRIASYVERCGGDSRKDLWRVFSALLSLPLTPNELQTECPEGPIPAGPGTR